MFQGFEYEVLNLIVVAILFTHCLIYRGKWDTLKIFGLGMLYGLFLENSGTFVEWAAPIVGPGYFYEQNYMFYLFRFHSIAGDIGLYFSAVPLATHLGWCSIFYISLTFWEKISEAFPSLRKTPWKAGICGGLIMAGSGLLIDLQLDVIATRFYWWVWNTSYLPIYYGVPLTNYIAWFVAVGVFGAFWAGHHVKTKDLEPKKQTIKLLWLLPIIVIMDGLLFFAIQGFFSLFGLIFDPANPFLGNPPVFFGLFG